MLDFYIDIFIYIIYNIYIYIYFFAVNISLKPWITE